MFIAKKNKEKKPSIGYVAIEVIIVMTIVIIGGIFAISSFFIKGQDNYTEVEKAEKSKVTNMYGVFSGTGAGTTKYSIKGLNTWNTQSATTMSNMFAASGNGKVTRYELDLSGWNTSSVTDMTSMFATSGKNATYFNIIGIENWNTSSVTNMQEMFISTGAKATGDSPYIDLSKWITTKVANYTNFAANAGRIIAPTW